MLKLEYKRKEANYYKLIVNGVEVSIDNGGLVYEGNGVYRTTNKIPIETCTETY